MIEGLALDEVFILLGKTFWNVTTNLTLEVEAIAFKFESYAIDFTNLGDIEVEVETPLLYLMPCLSPKYFVLLRISFKFFELSIILLIVEVD